MAEVYDVIRAYQLMDGDYARIAGRDIVVTEVTETEDAVYVRGNAQDDSDEAFYAEVDPDLTIELLTE